MVVDLSVDAEDEFPVGLTKGCPPEAGSTMERRSWAKIGRFALVDTTPVGPR